MEQYFSRWLALHEKANHQSARGSEKCWRFWARRRTRGNDLRRPSAGWPERSPSSRRSTAPIATMARRSGLCGSEVAIDAGRFDDAERFLKQQLADQVFHIGADDPDLKKAKQLMVGHYQQHANDREGHVLWHQLDVLAKRASQEHKHDMLGQIIESYAALLRRTNRVVPRPTEEDLAYLKKVGAVLPSTELDFLKRNLSGSCKRCSMTKDSLISEGFIASKAWT